MTKLRDFLAQSGLSIVQLAKKTSIDQSRLENLMSGSAEPDMDDLRKIAKVLKLPISYLVGDNKNLEKVRVMFRNEIKAGKNLYEADKFSVLISNSFALLQDYRADTSLINYFPPVESDFENARILAIKFREVYFEGDQVSPMFDLPRILEEKLRCIIYVSEIGADGASAYIDQVPFIFISPRFEGRMLFTCAHELGHILAHYDKSNDFVHYDEDIFKDSKSSNAINERFANVFASNLLLPEKGVGIALKKIREFTNNQSDTIGDVELLYLCRLYGVSFESAAMRLEDLTILPKGSSYSISVEIKKRYGSPEKRAEELGLPPRIKVEFPKVSPTLLSNAIDKIREGQMSIGKASEILSISIKEILAKNVSALN